MPKVPPSRDLRPRQRQHARRIIDQVMIRLVHHSLHVPVDVDRVLRGLAGPQDEWLGARAVDDRSLVLPLVPAGLTPEPHTPVTVALALGPMRLHDDEVLRRLSFGVADMVPETRCDLTVRAAVGHGVWFRLQGEFRGAATIGPDRQAEAVEAVMQPLLHHIADRVAALRCSV